MNLSIIVPVYNTEQYLDRCIKSLLSQNIGDYEIILIDDGSTDNSGDIVEQFAHNSQIVRVIHQNNKGLSGARNTGLRNARGDYVVFVDSDDWIEKDSIGNLFLEAKKLDLEIGIADFRYVDEHNCFNSNLEIPFHTENVVTGVEFFKESLKTNITMMVWKSIYKREFLMQHRLFFREGYNHEDEEWTPRVYLKANRVKDIQLVFYNYFIHKNTISKNPKSFEKNSIDLISNCYTLKELSMEIKDSELRDLFQNRIIHLYLSAIYKGRLISKKNSKILRKDFFDDMYYSGENTIKTRLFCFNKYLYYYLNRISKALSGSG